MNKLNYQSVLAIIVILASNVFLYFNLNKQNLNIKKDISDLKQEQADQQASQKEAIVNLQNLVTFNWKTYQNDKFGFSFKYPDYATICDFTQKLQNVEKTELNLVIFTWDTSGDCSKLILPAPQIIVKKNTENYKTAEEAFYKEFPLADKSLNPGLSYFKVDNINAFGGVIKSKIPESNIISGEESYEIVILKNDYIIKFNVFEYAKVDTNQQGGSKPIIDATIPSFYFYQ